jgi:hypothetical protein
LIAPQTVILFAKDWKRIGTKASLQETIAEITRIPPDILSSQHDPSTMPIAARMSWAAGRKTTRIEDRAYSLMGLFGIYMSPIYGEGEHAFIRLQKEILQVSDDHTIFAWQDKQSTSTGILATSPDMFKKSGDYERIYDDRRQFSMTNIGLLVHLTLCTIKNRQVALLNCRRNGTSKRLAIHVKKSSYNFQYQYEKESNELFEYDDRQIQNPQGLSFKVWDLSTFEHVYLRYTRIAVSFSGGQVIRPVRVKDLNGDRPISTPKITGTAADHSLGVFHMPFLTPCILHFIHTPTNQPFVVVAGIQSGGIWLDLVLDFEMDGPDFEDIIESYDSGGECGDMPGRNLDRISKFLTGNVAILVEARRRSQSKFHNHPCYILNIRVVDKVVPSLPTSAEEVLS